MDSNQRCNQLQQQNVQQRERHPTVVLAQVWIRHPREIKKFVHSAYPTMPTCTRHIQVHLCSVGRAFKENSEEQPSNVVEQQKRSIYCDVHYPENAHDEFGGDGSHIAAYEGQQGPAIKLDPRGELQVINYTFLVFGRGVFCAQEVVQVTSRYNNFRWDKAPNLGLVAITKP